MTSARRIGPFLAVGFCAWVVEAGERSLTLSAAPFLAAALALYAAIRLTRRLRTR